MVFGRRTTLKVALLLLLNTGMRPEEMLAIRAESIVFDGNETIISITGHTCLGISLVWGLAGFVWLKLLMPVVYDLIDHIPTRIQHTLATALAVFLAVDVAFTIAAFTCWFDRQAGEPADTQFQAFFAEHFDDEFMSERFQTMSIYPCLAKR